MADADQAQENGPFRCFSALIERYRVVAFYALLLAVSWPYLFLTMGATDPLMRLGPLVLVGPSVCAFIVVFAARGTEGVRGLGQGLLRVGPGYLYLLSMVGVPACFLGAAYTVVAVGYPEELTVPSAESLINAAVNFTLIFVFAGLGEEFGWRGLALPRLQERYGPLAASGLVGLMWSAWHLPVGFGTRGWALENTVFLVSVTAAAFFYTWLFNRTGGSILAVALLHTTENAFTWPYQDAFGFEPPGFLFFDGLKAGVWVVLAVLVVLLTGGRLAHRKRAH